MKDGWFYALIFGCIGGVALHSFFTFNLFAALFLLFLCCGVLAYLKLFSGKSFQSPLLLAFLFVVALCFGFIRYDVSIDEIPEEYLRSEGSEVVLTGIVDSEPDEREKITLITFKPHTESLRILLTTDRYPEYFYGDEIKITGKLERPKTFETEVGKIVNYPAYLEKEGVYFTVFRPDIEILSRQNGNMVTEKLLTLKQTFLSSIERTIPSPESALLGGILLGTKQALGKELSEIFRRSGIIHVVVLSGYNITIVATGIMWFFSLFLPLRSKLIVGGISIVLFAIMTGASATVVRASIMALIVLLAQATKHRYVITRALLLAGIVMILHNPKILIFDFGFQLSFLATLGLVYLSPLIEKYFTFVPTWIHIREVVLATLSTQIFVLPLLLFATGEMSIVSLPTNLLILPLIPVTMLLGFITGILGMIHPFIALPFGYITYLFLHAELSIATFFGTLSQAEVTLSNFGPAMLILSYTIIALITGFLWYRPRRGTIDTESV